MASAAAAAGGGAPPAEAPYKSNLEPGIADILLRSRQTILDVLEDRGYDTTVYRNIAPEQILMLAEGNPRTLDIFVPKRADSTAPCDRAVVAYIIQDRIRARLGTFKNIYDPTTDAASKISDRDDLIVILNEPYHEAFDKTALELWRESKTRVSFFHIKQMVTHLGRHTLVPPHRKLSAEEEKAVMEKLHVKDKTQFPIIKHDDVQARLLGLVPGDMVEIKRPSPTAGVAIVYRVCRP